jgi:hypothetical protein
VLSYDNIGAKNKPESIFSHKTQQSRKSANSDCRAHVLASRDRVVALLRFVVIARRRCARTAIAPVIMINNNVNNINITLARHAKTENFSRTDLPEVVAATTDVVDFDSAKTYGWRSGYHDD